MSSKNPVKVRIQAYCDVEIISELKELHERLKKITGADMSESKFIGDVLRYGLPLMRQHVEELEKRLKR